MFRDFSRIDWGPGAEERWYEFEKEIRSMPSLEESLQYFVAPTSSTSKTSNGQSNLLATAHANLRTV
jgi:hypothetical protein